MTKLDELEQRIAKAEERSEAFAKYIHALERRLTLLEHFEDETNTRFAAWMEQRRYELLKGGEELSDWGLD